MGLHNQYEKMRRGEIPTTGQILKLPDGSYLKAWGTTVPTDGTAGYAPGCTFTQTDGGANTAFYINEGTADSCDFNVLEGTGDVKADGSVPFTGTINGVGATLTGTLQANSLTATNASTFNAATVTGTGLTVNNATTTNSLSVTNGATVNSLTVSNGSTLNNVTMIDAANVAMNATTGTMLATNATQKMGFWGVTPVVQTSNAGTFTGMVGNGATNEDAANMSSNGGIGNATYTFGDVVRVLKLSGMAAANAV